MIFSKLRIRFLKWMLSRTREKIRDIEYFVTNDEDELQKLTQETNLHRRIVTIRELAEKTYVLPFIQQLIRRYVILCKHAQKIEIKLFWLRHNT